jgi:peptidoglycan/LPS O-acetylase OafA/YrhL
MAPSNKLIQIILVAPAAVMCVALAAADPLVSRLLRRPTPQWLGRVSYSLYLTHLPILLCLMAVFSGPSAAAYASLIGIPLSLLFAELFFRWVESPFMALSRRVGLRLARARQAQLPAE